MKSLISVLFVFVFSILCNAQSVYTWPSGQVNLSNPAGFNPITLLPSPIPSSKDTVAIDNDTLFLALSRTLGNNSSITGGPLVWNMDITSGNANYSELNITFKQYAVGVNFCITGLNCGGTSSTSFIDRVVITGEGLSGSLQNPIITGDSLTIVGNSATAVCGNGDVVIGAIPSEKLRIRADKSANVTFDEPLKKITIRFYNSGSTTPVAQNIGICDLNYSKALPVKLLVFNAVQDEEKVLLRWKTEQEESFEKFVVERSGDVKAFESIGTEASKIGEKNLLKSYSFADLSPRKGINYYRLKMVDQNGNYEYSKIISQMYSANSFQLKTYPNPLSLIETLKINNLSEIKELYIYDIVGKPVPFSITSNEIQFRSPGTFFVKAIGNNGQIKNGKVIVK
jgi:hypothetical protein